MMRLDDHIGEIRAERPSLREGLIRLTYGRSSGEVEPLDVLAALLSAIPATAAARGAVAVPRTLGGLLRRFAPRWPTREELMLGRFPVRRVRRLSDLLQAQDQLAEPPAPAEPPMNLGVPGKWWLTP